MRGWTVTAAYTGRVIWYCPYCETELDDDGDGGFCRNCGMGFSSAALAAADPESGEGF